MGKDWLKGISDYYDVIVIGSGLAGLTGANYLARQGHSVLVLEHHYQFGGLSTWFTRRGGHTFDISLHGFPVGMIKSCRKYWTREIADSIRQLKHVRFVNPQFDITTPFDREDFTRQMIERFGIPYETVHAFYEHLETMNFYDQDKRTTRELFDEYFPGRSDVHRLLMEPIAYANGSTQDDPAITYGIVFSNFMSKGVFIYQGGTDQLIERMVAELQKNGAELRKRCLVERIILQDRPEEGRPGVCGVRVNGRDIACRVVLSNSNIKNTIFELAGTERLDPAYVEEARKVRVNNSSCQVYMGVKAGESIPEIGDLVFTSNAPQFSSKELLDFHTTSRTFSLYYPDTRPHTKIPRYAVVASLNARWEDWANLPDDVYKAEKQRICDESIASLDRFIPGVRDKLDWIEAATPRTVNFYTRHMNGTSFGTKFEGLKVSMDLSEQVRGLYHAGSVGIIMSGWLGTINYGVITANRMDQFLYRDKQAREAAAVRAQIHPANPEAASIDETEAEAVTV